MSVCLLCVCVARDRTQKVSLLRRPPTVVSGDELDDDFRGLGSMFSLLKPSEKSEGSVVLSLSVHEVFRVRREQI